jgi:hypothetical protein
MGTGGMSQSEGNRLRELVISHQAGTAPEVASTCTELLLAEINPQNRRCVQRSTSRRMSTPKSLSTSLT